MFGKPNPKLMARAAFIRRLGWSVATGGVLIFISLTLGVFGYHFLCGMAWIDSFLDAAMILSGMGPVSSITTTTGKLFAGVYAIYCGIALIGTTGVIMAPVIHRALHRFHLEDSDQK